MASLRSRVLERLRRCETRFPWSGTHRWKIKPRTQGGLTFHFLGQNLPKYESFSGSFYVSLEGCLETHFFFGSPFEL